MNGDFVPFELAVKLKEKGFREKCLAYYTPYAGVLRFNTINVDKRPRGYTINFAEFYECYNCYVENNIDAPTISQVLKWLRKKHSLYVCPTLNTYRGNRKKDKACNLWMFQVINITNNHLIYPHPLDMHDIYETYEEAAFAGITYVVDNLI